MIHAKKSLGQNFLMHARIAERIVLVSGVGERDTVFEIGPGTGMLTRELLKKAWKVIALEADYELYEKLQIDFANDISDGRLELIHGDIREMNHISRYSVKEGTFGNGGSGGGSVLKYVPQEYVLVANIPYYLTGEIFRLFLTAENQPRAITLLVQKEVAERVVARGGKESVLSLSVKAYGTPTREFLVPRGAFRPAPNVDSALLTVRDISRARFATREVEAHFFALLHAGFAHKRKYVRNNLMDAGFDAGDIAEKARAEDISLDEWLALAMQSQSLT